MGHAPSLAEEASDYHFLSAGLLIFALSIRIALAISTDPVSGAAALLPRRNEWSAMRGTLLFYVSLGRAPLPRWYAHNPLWKPLYLLLYLLLILLAISGSLMPDRLLLLGWYLPSLHRELASVVLWLTLLHILAIVLHDYRGKSADVSSMINGNRYFGIEKPQVEPPATPQKVSIGIDQIGK
jgi:Ni/Fe-hydrogenase 1 B-type cytochrome subunit